MMRPILVLCVLLAPLAGVGGEKKKDGPTTTQKIQKLLKGVDKIIVRDGGDICCDTAKETLKQKVFFTVEDQKEIKQLLKGLKFKNGTKGNDCMCCGYPGVDFYRDGKRVLLSSYKHGFGLMSKSRIAYFTPDTRIFMAKWLLKHKFPDKHGECKKIAEAKKKKE